MELRRKIENKEAVIGIVGLGYVGLPLSLVFLKKGFPVYGIDISRERIEKLKQGISYVDDVKGEEILYFVKNNKFRLSDSYEAVKECDVINICVPTPFTPTRDPDLSYVINASRGIREYLKKGQLIILRSTTYPETTEKVVLPILEETGLKVGKDFYLSFAPERVDPGNKKYTMENTPVVVGGVTGTCTELTYLLYSKVTPQVKKVSSPKIAEMTKLLENIFRSVNIALVNELAILCERMGIDIWEVIDAASTKPFGFMPFYPGPGIGGHCILVDPYYLSWKAREYDFHSNFIALAAQVNENMPYHVVSRLFEISHLHNIRLKDSTILFLGVAFKKNVGDTRNSPALKIIEILNGRVGRIIYNDPHVPEVKIWGERVRSVPLTEKVLKEAAITVITAAHSAYDYHWIVEHANIIFDTRNATKGIKSPKVYRLGAPNP